MTPWKGWKRIFDRDELKQLAARIEARGGKLIVADEEALGDALERARSANHVARDESTAAQPEIEIARVLGSAPAR